MERYYTENREYPVEAVLNERFKNVPPEASDAKANYVLKLARSVSSFTITAEPNAKGVMLGDRCGSFTLDNFGRKVLKNYSTAKFDTEAAALEYCWR